MARKVVYCIVATGKINTLPEHLSRPRVEAKVQYDASQSHRTNQRPDLSIVPCQTLRHDREHNSRRRGPTEIEITRYIQYCALGVPLRSMGSQGLLFHLIYHDSSADATRGVVATMGRKKGQPVLRCFDR